MPKESLLDSQVPSVLQATALLDLKNGDSTPCTLYFPGNVGSKVHLTLSLTKLVMKLHMPTSGFSSDIGPLATFAVHSSLLLLSGLPHTNNSHFLLIPCGRVCMHMSCPGNLLPFSVADGWSGAAREAWAPALRVPTLHGPCCRSPKRRGSLRFLPSLEMRPSSIAPNPAEFWEARQLHSIPHLSEAHWEVP